MHEIDLQVNACTNIYVLYAYNIQTRIKFKGEIWQREKREGYAASTSRPGTGDAWIAPVHNRVIKG